MRDVRLEPDDVTRPLSSNRRRVVDGFAGPGGWSEGLKALGYEEIGIEWDEAACATARAAGHERVMADVSVLDPMDFAPCWGAIFSPPCPTFSNAGKGAGRQDMEHVIACAHELMVGNDTRAERKAKCEDERSILVVEPLRWALALRPEWIALEQVPPVLELWTLFGYFLETLGYSVWTGVLEAERYGVPQTRERAILMAHKSRTVHPPRPTHQRYVPGQPQRHDVTLEGEVLPWVSMAEALGWAGSVRTNNFTAKRRDLDGSRTKAGSVPYERDASAPAPTLTNRVDCWALDRRQGGAPVRTINEPAHTMSSQGLAKGRDIWLRNNNQTNAARRRGSEPAPTVLFGHALNEVGWVGAPDERVNKTGQRVTIEQALTLQSFRPDYPVQGTRAKRFEQVGNAVPPLLARAVLAELVDPAMEGSRMTPQPFPDQRDFDRAVYAVRFVAEACEASGVRPKMAAGYRALEARLVLGEPPMPGDDALIERAIRFERSHRND